MEGTIFYDENGKVWLIVHGTSDIPTCLKSMVADIPEDAQLTGMDLSDPDNPSPVFYYAESAAVVTVENLVALVKKRVATGENLRTVISGMNLTDEEKWELEKRVKEG